MYECVLGYGIFVGREKWREREKGGIEKKNEKDKGRGREGREKKGGEK